MLNNLKQFIKVHRTSKNRLLRSSASIIYIVGNRLWSLKSTSKRILTDSDFRSTVLLQITKSKNVHQTTSLTYMDRYPEIFSACKEHFEGKKDIKILSYGCSTGEEVLSLRKYFPNATITGAEINKRSLSICRKLPIDDKINFVYSTTNEIRKMGPFDAIFCMAVLQRTPSVIIAKGITNLEKIYPFEKFNQQIVEFDELLNEKGLLIICYSQYMFKDSTVASKYEPLNDIALDTYNAPLFDAYSNIIQNPIAPKNINIKIVK